MQVQIQKMQKAAQNFSDAILRKPKDLFRFALNLVIRQLVKNAERISRPQFDKLKKEVDKLEALIRQREFVKKYKVKVIGEGKVSFTLPKGSSRLDLLKEAQALTPKLIGSSAIDEGQLITWEYDSNFTTPLNKDKALAIDGKVEGSTLKDRVLQETMGWNNVDLADLAVAHQVYLIATKNDLFDGCVVRARGGALVFRDSKWLMVIRHDPGCSPNLAASALLPSRNKKS